VLSESEVINAPHSSHSDGLLILGTYLVPEWKFWRAPPALVVETNSGAKQTIQNQVNPIRFLDVPPPSIRSLFSALSIHNFQIAWATRNRGTPLS
jgi:hypothetical protein